MEKLIREYERDGFSVKIYAPDATEGEKAVRRAEIKEKVVRAVKTVKGVVGENGKA